MNAAPSSVAVFVSAYSWPLLFRICRRLKDEFGSAIHLYCVTKENVEHYRKLDADGLFATVTRAAALLDTVGEAPADRETVFAQARAYEARYGLTVNRLAVGNRHFGRGYALAGFHHHRSRYSEETDYARMLAAYNAAFAFWEREIATKGLTLLLSGPLEAIVCGRAHGIPYRGLANSRYRNYFYWSTNEYFENPPVAAAFARAAVADDASVELDEPFVHEREHRAVFERSEGLWPVLRRAGRTAAQHAWGKYKGYDKAKGYFLRDKLEYFARRYAALKRMSGPSLPTLSDLGDRPFVFFPLHTEPESAVQQQSPEFFYQHAAIAALSRDLPAGVLLAVKETIHGAGRRPRDFYDQIAALKNVAMLNALEHGVKIVKRAAAVATITGTAGFEAAVMGRPVLSFGRHNVYNCVPHVYAVETEAEIRAALASIFGGGFDPTKARRDGARFLRAVLECSFDMEEFSFYRAAEISDRVLDNAYRALVASLAVEASAPGAFSAVS